MGGFDIGKIFDLMMQIKMMDLVFGGAGGGGGLFGGGGSAKSGIDAESLGAILDSTALRSFSTVLATAQAATAAASDAAGIKAALAPLFAAWVTLISQQQTSALIQSLSGSSGDSGLALVLATR